MKTDKTFADVEDAAKSGEGKNHKDKKKKDKRREVSNGSNLMGCEVSNGSNLMGSVDGVEKKRKKKRHTFADGIASEHVDSESLNMLGSLEVDSGVKKKKKKWREPANDFTPANVIGSSEVDTGVIKEKRKKKKKQKTIREEEEENCIASEDAQMEAAEAMGSGHGKVHSAAKKRKKQRIEVSNGIASEGVQFEATNVMNSRSVKVDSGPKKKQIQGTSDSIVSENIKSPSAKDKKKQHDVSNHNATEDTRYDSTNDVDFSDTVSKKKIKCNKTKELLKDSCDHSAEKIDEKEGSKKVKKRKKNADAADSSKKKRVRFSDNVEVFTFPEYLKYRELNSEGDLVHGKRYSPEDDAKIMQAIDDYIVEHGLANDGVDKDQDKNWKRARNMIMNCKEHRELKGCWKDISLAIPWRTADSVYQRAHLLYERAEQRKWSKEEIDMVLSFHEKHGPKWRELGDFLGKSRKHVKDAYRRNNLSGEKKGAWSQEEYQKLFDLVNHDICLKALQEKKVKHGMLRDNIAWGAISESIGTRAGPTCCNKWYYQICSSMVVEGKWSDTDDYKLVDALYSQDACCIEDVGWDSLLEHRSGDLCQKRWAEMARNLGEYRHKPFLEQVEVFHQRYDRDLIEARETYEKKDPVDV